LHELALVHNLYIGRFRAARYIIGIDGTGRAMKQTTQRSMLAAAVALVAVPAIASQPPSGVYACYEASYTQGAPGCVPSSVGCFGIAIKIAPVMMFGLIDETTYSDYDGHRGRYSFDQGSGVITMSDGSLRGVRYKKIDEWSFVKLDDKNRKTAFTCPLDKKKNPLVRPW